MSTGSDQFAGLPYDQQGFAGQPVRDALVKNAKATSDLHIACRVEVERLRAALRMERADAHIVEAARAFVEQHQIGQPGTPGTLYPMTYGVQDAWHEEWDRRLATLIAACQT